MAEENGTKPYDKPHPNAVDGTTWEFLQAGWWILHVVGIGLVFWLGHVLWPVR